MNIKKSENVRLAARCEKHGIEMVKTYSLSKAFVLLEKSPVWVGRMVRRGDFEGAKRVERTTDLGGVVITWAIPADALECYLSDQEAKEERKEAAKADPRAYYRQARNNRKPMTVKGVLANLSETELQELREELLVTLVEPTENRK